VRALPKTELEVMLTDDQVAAFRRDGFTSIPRITTDEEVEWLREVFDELFAEKAGGFPGGYFDLARPYDADGEDHLPQVLVPEQRVPDLRRTQFFRNAHAITGQLLDHPEEQLLAWGHMIHKPARHGHEIPWHQDEAYWDPKMAYRAVGSWLPLDDADLDNGCMCFLPGSHTGPVHPHRHIDDDPAVHGLVTDVTVGVGMVPVPLAAGGATFHHPRTLHHTPPNRSDRQRRAVAVEHQTAPVPRDSPEPRPWIDAGMDAWAARPVIAGTPAP
jgi:ectoine hydroxylase-related dioxygenase (phytanoyl-CoA dioxygenase family)